MKIGLYFGSFNPIHVGHLIIANHVASFTQMQQVWFVISPQNPLKPSSELLNEYHRLVLIQKAIENNIQLKVTDVEFRLPRPSFTIDTLTHLTERYPKHQFSIIMGSDSYTNLPRWKNYQLILKNYPIIIYNRLGFEIHKENIAENITVLDAPILDISASIIRKNIKKGKSIQYLVTEAVEKEIMENSYYK